MAPVGLSDVFPPQPLRLAASSFWRIFMQRSRAFRHFFLHSSSVMPNTAAMIFSLSSFRAVPLYSGHLLSYKNGKSLIRSRSSWSGKCRYTVGFGWVHTVDIVLQQI
uniref:Putative alcohol dehydrogenase transcription factor myb/sant-like protein n=1 Tax=Ixodes ricinus TaxID=34613 RepID=A0A0K8RCN3_IXORI